MKVLCIDDAPDILEVLSLSLKMRWPDVEVLEAEDGPAALGLFERENPDLLIVDLGLPGMDGAVRRALWQLPGHGGLGQQPLLVPR